MSTPPPTLTPTTIGRIANQKRINENGGPIYPPCLVCIKAGFPCIRWDSDESPSSKCARCIRSGKPCSRDRRLENPAAKVTKRRRQTMEPDVYQRFMGINESNEEVEGSVASEDPDEHDEHSVRDGSESLGDMSPTFQDAASTHSPISLSPVTAQAGSGAARAREIAAAKGMSDGYSKGSSPGSSPLATKFKTKRGSSARS